MSRAFAARPLARASVEDRVDYLKSVGAITFGGLLVSAISGIASAIFIAPFLSGRFMSMAVILGSFGVAQYVAPKLVFGEQKWAGFLLGSVFQGIAMGYLLLMAVIVSMGATGSAFLLIGQALGLTTLTMVGILAYLWSGPQELSLVKAGLSAMFIPMVILMGVSFVFPIGGVIGIGISALFVVVSAAGLLYQTNIVLHQLDTSQKVEGAYLITMGVLVLFWNLLTLLMSLSGRD